jgi:transposase-like protein
MEPTVWLAREAHRKVGEHTGQSHHYRQERDRLIRELYASGDYSYSQLAGQIGCSPELVAKVVQGRS